ncbi:predicted protein [Nematostella vectensis]|uniref:ubiquitinyl hydrolase 1 n=1 Tax=Nematostella vectensis TaxID=45351 RepID=A7S8P2_NEMVE|nr:predicted protein [Nematostella vectensis]|eukprot:XP_001631968.1 predicted protein [Nematostella vectensis]
MGLRESKLCFLPYEEAVKRVTEEEMQRLRLAFKRSSGVSGLMPQNMFSREVLGDGVPSKVCEQIYGAIGGTGKGVTFRDLLCGLVLLTRGTREEKIKFIFNVYSSDGTYVTKDCIESLILACDGGNIPQVVSDVFSEVDRLTFDEFSHWLLKHPDVTTLTRWLLIVSSGCSLQLTDNSETPTFYQTLATVTHLQELDIIELEKKYWFLKSASKSGKFDLETFTMLASPPIPSSACKGLFQAFDENNDGHIDFREMACGISACCRGSSSERQQFCFRVFDCDQDGFLSRDELELMSKILLQIRKENSPEKDGKVNLEEFQVWSNLHRFSLLFPKLLVQVCHIVLGLRPLTREVELQGLAQVKTNMVCKPVAFGTWYLCHGGQPTRRSSTGSMKKNGTIPSKPNQTANNTPTWSSESLRTRTILRRESHPSYPNTAVTKNESMNGHCTPEVEPGPGQIDNTSLIEPETRKVMILTGEGGRLKRSVPLGRVRDFEILPEPVWRALLTWYGGGPALPRTVVVPLNGDCTPELELFPLNLKIYRHSPPPTRGGITTWTGVGFGLSSFGFNTNSMTASHAPPKKYLAYLAAFSYINTLQQNTLHLLEEENSSLRDLNLTDNMNLLLEVRNRDMSWPEEMSSLASSKSLREKLNLEPTEKGATGLSNLGNTCFMNSALQCLSNTQPLTQFFTAKCHYYELNRTNPLGMKGHIARRYGDLVEDLWSGSSRSLAPLKLRWTIGRYAPRFNGFQQHDAQEFLSFLLDGLHEDLNRVHDKPYVELKDSDGRLDEIVAQEAWDNHIKRNQSIIVDLFQGQLKSQVRCVECGYVSARFDPFTFLSLPLPMDNSIFIEIVVVPLSGATPVKYGLLLNNDDKYKAVRKELAKLCVINVAQLLLVEVYGATVKSLPTDSQKIRSALGGILYAYEVPENAYDTPTSSPSVASRQQIVTSFKKTPTIVPESEEDANKCESNAPPRLDNKPKLSSQGCSASDSGISMNNDQSPTIHNRRVGTGGDGVETPSSGPSPYLGYCFKGFVVAIHRKMNRSDAYFLSPQKNRPSLFGVPVVVPCTSRTKHCELYQTVWKQVSRLLSAPAPGDKNAKDGNTGDYPFELRVVQKDGVTCAWCSWFRFCRGCLIKCSDQEFGNSSSYIAIEWDPTTLHLRYQSSLEKNCEEHESVERSRRLQTEPIDLYECLRAFTNEEELGDEELWYCNKCKKHRLAVKKLEIWSLPPILVIHLKRFQYVNGHWVKSNKIVNYPMAGFDPSAFLVPRPPGSHLTVRSENTTVTTVTVRSSVKEEKEEDNTNGCASCSSRDMDCSGATTSQVELNTKNNSRNSSISSLNSAKVHPEVSGSKVARDHSTPSPCRDGSCRDAPFRDGASHDVACRDGSCRDVPFRDGASPDSACPGIDCRDGPCHANGCCDDPSQENIRYRASSMSFKTPVYRLYAMSCHSGVLGGGHYISYSHNPNGKWYCYNDSSCKECDVNKMHVDSPYLLFYQQDDLNEKAFLPSVRDRTPDNVSDDEDFENDVKRMCSVQ